MLLPVVGVTVGTVQIARGLFNQPEAIVEERRGKVRGHCMAALAAGAAVVAVTFGAQKHVCCCYFHAWEEAWRAHVGDGLMAACTTRRAVPSNSRLACVPVPGSNLFATVYAQVWDEAQRAWVDQPGTAIAPYDAAAAAAFGSAAGRLPGRAPPGGAGADLYALLEVRGVGRLRGALCMAFAGTDGVCCWVGSVRAGGNVLDTSRYVS